MYSPHIDFGQGSHTALGQMLADELDADWSKVKVEQAPADTAFANSALGKGFLAEMSGAPGVINALPGGDHLDDRAVDCRCRSPAARRRFALPARSACARWARPCGWR